MYNKVSGAEKCCAHRFDIGGDLGMREIKAEGTGYIYFVRSDSQLLDTVFGVKISLVPPFMERQLQISTDFRLVLIRAFSQPDVGVVYYLHWDNGQDLNALDRKIELNAYADEDFTHAAKTVFQQTKCSNCGKVWSTLVLPLGDPYLGAPGLEERKLHSHTIIRHCPDCHTPFRQLVAKIF